MILSNPTASSYSTVADLATTAGVTKATVVRLCQSLGYPGFGELRHVLRGGRTLEQLWPLDLLQESESERQTSAGLATIHQDLENLQNLVTPEFQRSLDRAVGALAAAEHILVISSGSHAGTGLMLSHNLNFIGRPAILENRGSTYLGQALSVLTPRDVVVSLVFWHVPPEITNALQWCQEHSIRTLAITNSPLSGTAQHADLTLTVPTESSSFFRSQTAAMATVNALIAELAGVDPDRTVAAMSRAQSAWDTLGIYKQ